MLKRIREFSKYVELAGFKNAKINDVNGLCEQVNKLKTVEIQLFDAQKIATWQHLFFAALNAANVFEKKTNVSRSLAIEMMRFASGQRQIRNAVSAVGIKAGCFNVAVVIVGDEKRAVNHALDEVAEIIGGKIDDSVLELTPRKKRKIEKVFEISPMELNAATEKGETDQALINLVLERVALVSTQR
jgi:KEOPS complex subunit Cgi121